MFAIKNCCVKSNQYYSLTLAKHIPSHEENQYLCPISAFKQTTFFLWSTSPTSWNLLDFSDSASGYHDNNQFHLDFQVSKILDYTNLFYCIDLLMIGSSAKVMLPKNGSFLMCVFFCDASWEIQCSHDFLISLVRLLTSILFEPVIATISNPFLLGMNLWWPEASIKLPWHWDINKRFLLLSVGKQYWRMCQPAATVEHNDQCATQTGRIPQQDQW